MTTGSRSLAASDQRPKPRRENTIEVSAVSTTSATVAARVAATRTSPGPEGSSAKAPTATAPAAAPTNARLNRYVIRPATGRLQPTAEAPNTAIPARGPKSTAAKTDGN